MRIFVVERGGFEPPKSLTTDLQSAPFGHSGTSPYGAGDRNRTNNLLITNQLLCLLSYTSVLSCWCLGADSNHRHRDFQSLALPPELPRHTGFQSPFWNLWQWRLSLPQTWWRPGGGSNPWPPAWQAGVLTNCTTGPNNFMFWWAFTDSNRGPIGYEPTALTNWAKGPNHIGEVVLVGVKRFELPTFWTQIRRASQTALHPERFSRRSLRLQQYTINPKSCQWFFW